MNNTHTWTALVTPFSEDLAIDFSALEKLVRRQEEAGNGIVLAGSTGEGLALTDAEKSALVDCVAGLCLKVPVVVGIAGFQIDQALRFVRTCAKKRVDGFLFVTPIYARPGLQGQIHWFKTLLDAAKLPCILYNIPKRAGCDLAVDAVKALQDHPNFWAIKEASGVPANVVRYREAAPKVKIYCGWDDMTRSYAREGAWGLISVIGNLWPTLTHDFVEECVKNPFGEDAEELIAVIRRANHNNPVAAKAYLYAKRLIATPYLRPPLSHLDMEGLKELHSFDISLARA